MAPKNELPWGIPPTNNTLQNESSSILLLREHTQYHCGLSKSDEKVYQPSRPNSFDIWCPYVFKIAKDAPTMCIGLVDLAAQNGTQLPLRRAGYKCLISLGVWYLAPSFTQHTDRDW